MSSLNGRFHRPFIAFVLATKKVATICRRLNHIKPAYGLRYWRIGHRLHLADYRTNAGGEHTTHSQREILACSSAMHHKTFWLLSLRWVACTLSNSCYRTMRADGSHVCRT